MAVLVLATALVGCGGSDHATTSTTPAACRAVGGDTVTIAAVDMAFADRCLSVEPGVYTVTFDNQDEGTGHDLHITGDGVDARSRLFVGPGTDDFTVDLSRPGTYRYVCDPHANMVGTLVVTEPAATTPSPDGSTAPAGPAGS